MEAYHVYFFYFRNYSWFMFCAIQQVCDEKGGNDLVKISTKDDSVNFTKIDFIR